MIAWIFTVWFLASMGFTALLIVACVTNVIAAPPAPDCGESRLFKEAA